MAALPEWISAITSAIEVVGIFAIVSGAVLATGRFAWSCRTAVFDSAYREYRRNLGRAILLGLELLVAADIVGTVAVSPTLQSVAVLGVIVLIRTWLSVSLEVEITGRWPWRRSTEASAEV